MLVTLGYAEKVQSYESRQALMAKASQSEGAALETWTDWTKWSEWDGGNEFGRGRKKETDKIKKIEWKDGKMHNIVRITGNGTISTEILTLRY